MADLSKLEAPPGTWAQVSVINTCHIHNIPAKTYLDPVHPALERFDVPCFAFIIENNEGRRVLFDLGLRKDWHNIAAIARAEIEEGNMKIQMADYDIVETLANHGIQPVNIEAVILSHHHFDHVGDLTLFPSSTTVVVGPGYQAAHFPGYPECAAGEVLTKDYMQVEANIAIGSNSLHTRSGKCIKELDFEAADAVRKIGSYSAIDFFGDGSFFLLDTPGHSVGHITGLVRTTSNPDTFIVLGGDTCHHPGEMRPSDRVPLDKHADSQYLRYLIRIARTSVCPFFAVPRDAEITRSCHSISDTEESIRNLQSLDACDNVFTILSHDASICDVLKFFPDTLNGWKALGWRELSFWAFLKDLQE